MLSLGSVAVVSAAEVIEGKARAVNEPGTEAGTDGVAVSSGTGVVSGESGVTKSTTCGANADTGVGVGVGVGVDVDAVRVTGAGDSGWTSSVDPGSIPTGGCVADAVAASVVIVAADRVPASPPPFGVSGCTGPGVLGDEGRLPIGVIAAAGANEVALPSPVAGAVTAAAAHGATVPLASGASVVARGIGLPSPPIAWGGVIASPSPCLGDGDSAVAAEEDDRLLAAADCVTPEDKLAGAGVCASTVVPGCAVGLGVPLPVPALGGGFARPRVSPARGGGDGTVEVG